MSDTFLTQRIANAFPLWTKARRDPSSVAQRFFSPVAEILSHEYAVLAKASQDFSLTRDWLPWNSLLVAQLEVDDFINHEVSADGSITWIYPTTVTIDLGAGPVELNRLDESEDLFSQLPGSLLLDSETPVSNFVIYDSGVGVIQDIDYPCKLVIRVSDSSEYYLKGNGEFTSGRYFVDLTGLDLVGNVITDRVVIRDDGSYFTNEFFSQITDINWHGFNGRVRVYLGSDINGLVNPYYIGVTDRGESPLRHTLDVSDGEAVLYSWVDREVYGANYRRGGEVLDVEDTEVWASILRDSDNIAFTPVDIAFDYNAGYLVVLDNSGYLHWFDSQRPNWTELSRFADLTVESFMEVHPLTSWSLAGEELQLFTRFQRPYISVNKVRIQHVTPGGTSYYLQADKATWDVTEYWHIYNQTPTVTEPTRTWQDFGFIHTLTDAGEHEFYIDVIDINNNRTVTGTKVWVQKAVALVSLDTSVVSSAGETPERLFLDYRGEFCVGTSEGNVWPVMRVYYDYFADPESQTLWLNLVAQNNNPSPGFALEIEVTY